MKEKIQKIFEQNIQPQAQKARAKETVVSFDKKTDHPWNVKFSERGFEIEGVRMSFEFLETALSKNVNLTLSGGSGITLDAVKMQKILKYKGLY